MRPAVAHQRIGIHEALPAGSTFRLCIGRPFLQLPGTGYNPQAVNSGGMRTVGGAPSGRKKVALSTMSVPLSLLAR